MPAKQTVPVLILGQEYRIRSESDPETVRRAAALLDDTMAKVRSRTGTVDSMDVAVLAALNLANHLVALRESSPSAVPNARIEALSEQVAALLEGSPAS